MPNLDFYALGDDYRLVFDFIFAQPGWNLREMYSRLEQPIRVFTSTAEILAATDPDAKAEHFALWSPQMGAAVEERRIDFDAATVAKYNATHRFEATGWGLIQLYTTRPTARGLGASHTNHNSEKRAQAWEPVANQAVTPWDFTEVKRISSRLNRYIARISTDKIGSRPILPAAHEARKNGLALLLNR